MARESNRADVNGRIIAGRIIHVLNSASPRLSKTALFYFLEHELTEGEIERQYQNYITDCLYLFVQNKQIEGGFRFQESRNSIYGIKTIDKDDRSAEEIINDTMAAHGIKVIK